MPADCECHRDLASRQTDRQTRPGQARQGKARQGRAGQGRAGQAVRAVVECRIQNVHVCCLSVSQSVCMYCTVYVCRYALSLFCFVLFPFPGFTQVYWSLEPWRARGDRCTTDATARRRHAETKQSDADSPAELRRLPNREVGISIVWIRARVFGLESCVSSYGPYLTRDLTRDPETWPCDED
ncbi:hypothetical protein F4803DRAFT_377995 [Xylaria telfairii]|nr:hypothetical protein F4803DRAFT_377995 [Xylaria telfairii]